MAVMKAGSWIVLILLGVPAVPVFSASADDFERAETVAEQKQDQTVLFGGFTQRENQAAVTDPLASAGSPIEQVDGQKVSMRDRFTAEWAESSEGVPLAGSSIMASDVPGKEDQMAEQSACLRLIHEVPGPLL